jgi:diguanylate cyclase (GGDEF)-like protein
MPRSFITRISLALLPALGAILAAIAGMEGWPMLASLCMLLVVGTASAVIFWSGPIQPKERTPIALEPLSEQYPLQLESAPDIAFATATAMADIVPAESSAALEMDGAANRTIGATRARQAEEQDLLTGLLEPEYFFSQFTQRLAYCADAGQPAVLVICDLDQFGELNRTAGLADANRLLRSTAAMFRLTVREGDLLARLGADEFALFFPGLSPEIAESRVRDLRAAVREAALQTLAEDSLPVTISVGISCSPRDGSTAEELFESADLALQAAKRLRVEQAGRPIRMAVAPTRVDAAASGSLG